MKQVSSVHSDPPLLLSHSAASTSCDSRLEEQLTPRLLHVADVDDDDIAEPSRYLLQHLHTPPSLSGQLAGNTDVTVQRVLCPYHQLIAAEPTALVASLRRTADEEALGGEKNVCRHEIDLIRDSTSRHSCERHTSDQRSTTASMSTLGANLSRTLGRAAHVSFTCDQQDDTQPLPGGSTDQLTC